MCASPLRLRSLSGTRCSSWPTPSSASPDQETWYGVSLPAFTPPTNHPALGRTSGIEAFADELRQAGHRVVDPDLYDGAIYDSIDGGVAHAGRVGFDVITDRGVAAANKLDDGLVVVGFSLGVLPAQKLAQTRSGVAGAVMCHGVIGLGEFGDAWPDHMPVQIHMVENDPWVEQDLDAAREIATAARRGELFLYPGSGHLVTDSSTPDYDPPVARQIMQRTLAFLTDVAGGSGGA